MGSGPASARTSRRRCSRSIPAITSGAARQMNWTSRRTPQDNVSLFFLLPGRPAPGSRLPNFGRGRQLRAGHRRYNFGWYRVADSAKLKQMCADTTTPSRDTRSIRICCAASRSHGQTSIISRPRALLDEQGRSEAAIECLRTALRVAPDYADAMFKPALLLQEKTNTRRPQITGAAISPPTANRSGPLAHAGH